MSQKNHVPVFVMRSEDLDKFNKLWKYPGQEIEEYKLTTHIVFEKWTKQVLRFSDFCMICDIMARPCCGSAIQETVFTHCILPKQFYSHVIHIY